MYIVSAKKLFLWKKEQLSKGGDIESLDLLIDLLGGLSKQKFNLIKIGSSEEIELKINLDSLKNYWERHLDSCVPIQYLAGYSFWRDIKVKVSNKVLIPRAETELIVDIASRLIEDKEKKIIFADLGTGSGAIAISLAIAYPHWLGIATDIDINALQIASCNFSNITNQSNLSFSCGWWWEPFNKFEGKIDLSISNPPYIPTKIFKKLPDSVKKFEPMQALCGGDDGLFHISEIIKNAPNYLKEKGWLILENHFDQGKKVKKLFIQNGFNSVEVLNDFAGIGRFTIGRYK